MADEDINIKKIALVIHIHYISTAEVIARAIQSSVLKGSDIYITLTPTAASQKEDVQKYFPKAHFFTYENRGRDIRPFFQVLKECKLTDRYDLLLKLHGKRTEALPGYGAFWLVDSLTKLLPTTLDQLGMLKNRIKTFGIAGPSKQLFVYDEKTDKNHSDVKKTLKLMDIQWKPMKNLYFFGGSMLWFDTKLLKQKYTSVIDADMFPEEKGQYDGTYAHAIERSFTLAHTLSTSKDSVQVVNFSDNNIRNMMQSDVSVDGLIREYEEFSSKAVLVSMSGEEYVLDYNDLKDLQKRRYKDRISSEQAIRTIDQPDNLHTLLVKTQEELARIKSSKKYRLLQKISSVKSAANPRRLRRS